ncbi:putative RNA recognition motif domain, nucleotide-binding alpha-beta plait domain superfamily [Helianthus annuus]|nr:putative RNA recognition motif domain, nucleotide-binding alpha-beta plait domain superfamily [Helianthus annuus]
MSSNPSSTVYIGNLDERVTDRVLYDILIQAGRVVDLHIPRDRETDKPKGFAFAEYETKEIADYAVKLFSGLVTLYNRTLRFGISGQDKAAPNPQTSPMLASNSSFKSRLNVEVSPNSSSYHTQDIMGITTIMSIEELTRQHGMLPTCMIVAKSVGYQRSGLSLSWNIGDDSFKMLHMLFPQTVMGVDVVLHDYWT